MTPSRRLGLYAWGGPGTVELLNVKYRGWGTAVDEKSFLEMYDPPFLDKAKKLGVTDMWVTYGWGFGEKREQPHREFLRRRLPGFRERGIRTHAYVQGPNVVTADFRGRDVFCQNPRGGPIPYSAGRSMVCLHNPEARSILMARVAAACCEDVDGVYMDNIVFGMPPNYVSADYAPFFGCACRWCRNAYARRFGAEMPAYERRGANIANCLRLRCAATAQLVKDCAALCRSSGKQFGVNLYDPVWHAPEFFFGYSLRDLAPHLSYLLFENHGLVGPGRVNNVHLRDVIREADKPAFIVSYRKGIGCDAQWSQDDIDAVASEAAALGYNPCLKASEFVDGRTWHGLRIRKWDRPHVRRAQLPAPLVTPLPLPASTPLKRLRSRAAAALQMRLSRTFFELPLPAWMDRRGLFARMCRAPHAFTTGVSAGERE